MNIADIEPGQFYSVAEVQALIPSPQRGKNRVCKLVIRRWLKRGQLKGRQINRIWYVTGAELLEFLGLRREPGGPWQKLSERAERDRCAKAIKDFVAKRKKGGRRGRQAAGAP